MALFTACGGEGSDDGTDTVAPLPATSYTMQEETDYSNAYTSMAQDYYLAVVEFNKLALFNFNTEDSNASKMSALLSQLNSTQLAINKAKQTSLALESLTQNIITDQVNSYRVGVDLSTDASDLERAKKLLSLYHSGIGPDRLTMDYIQKATNKDLGFLYALADTMSTQAEADRWNDHADAIEQAETKCKLIRDVAYSVDMVLLTVVGTPIIAGAATKAAVTVAANVGKFSKIYTGVNAVFQVYSKGKLLEAVGESTARVGIYLATGKAPAAVPTFTSTLYDKFPALKTADNVFTLFSGIEGLADANKYARVASMFDFKDTGSYFYDLFEDEKQINISSDGDLNSSFTIQSNELLNDLNVSEEESLALQLDSGDFSIPLLEDEMNIIFDDDVSTEIEFSDTIGSDEVVQFDGDKILISNDYNLKTDINDSTDKKISLILETTDTIVQEVQDYSISTYINNWREYSTVIISDLNVTGTYLGSYLSLTDSSSCLPQGTTGAIELLIDDDYWVYAKVTVNGNYYYDSGIAVDGSTIYNNGSTSNIEWYGTINGTLITGNFLDTDDNCDATFTLRKE